MVQGYVYGCHVFCPLTSDFQKAINCGARNKGTLSGLKGAQNEQEWFKVVPMDTILPSYTLGF